MNKRMRSSFAMTSKVESSILCFLILKIYGARIARWITAERTHRRPEIDPLILFTPDPEPPRSENPLTLGQLQKHEKLEELYTELNNIGIKPCVSPASLVIIFRILLIIMALSLLGGLFLIIGLTNAGFPPSTNATAMFNTTQAEIIQETDRTTFLPGTEELSYDTPVTINPLEDINKISPSSDYSNPSDPTNVATTITFSSEGSSIPPPTAPSAVLEDHSRRVKTKCTLGACSFRELNQPVPRHALNCTNIRSFEINPASKKSSTMNFIKCEDNCSYFSATMFDLFFSVLFEEKMHQIGAITIDTAWNKYCEDINIPITSHNASFDRLQGLRLKIPHECSEVYEVVSSFKAPLNYLTFERSFISKVNYHHVRQILRRNSKITMLNMSNITLCIHCNIFDDILFENLEVVTLIFTRHSNWSHVIRQLEVLINNSPKLKRITTNVQIPIALLVKFSEQLKNLERAKISVVLEFNNGSPSFSLEVLKGFPNLKHILVQLDVERNTSSHRTLPATSIKITDFKNINLSLQRLSLKSNSYRIDVDSKADKFCSVESSRNKGAFLCKRE